MRSHCTGVCCSWVGGRDVCVVNMRMGYLHAHLHIYKCVYSKMYMYLSHRSGIEVNPAKGGRESQQFM